MSEANKKLCREWFEEVWNQGRAESIDRLLAADAAVHGLGDVPNGPAGFKPFHAAFRDAFPDIRIGVDDLIAEGDKVAIRWSARATHNGNGLGFPSTGLPAQFTGMSIIRVRDGKLVEGWNNFDQLGMLQQLGVVALP